MKKAPDRLPEDNEMEYVHLPITTRGVDPTHIMNRIKQGDVQWITLEYMIESYIRMVEDFPGAWREVFTRMALPGRRPMLCHCTGGKDRTGVFAALLLLALGVSEDLVVYDHSLSNSFLSDRVESILIRVKSYGVDPEKFIPYFTAPKECIVALLNHIKKTYGSADDYLRKKAGVSKKNLARLRNELLQ
jgi:protein-tyrosine phosphatase